MNRCSNGLVCTTETACQPAQDLLKPEVILNAEQTEILRHPSVPAGKHLTALFYSSDVKHTGNAAKTWIEKQWNLVSRRMTHSGFGPQRCWNWNPQDSSLCSLCSLLKGTKGTKKTFGLIFIQARKFSGWSHQMYFCLRFPCVFACFSTFLTVDHFLMAQCCKCQFASVWTFKECCDIKMKMNIYFYVLVFFLDLFMCSFHSNITKPELYAQLCLLCALALDGNQLFVQTPLWFSFFIWYLLTLPMDHFDLLWDL